MPSIAVLPFENVSTDPDQEHFSIGLSEDLITELANVPGMAVAARSSVFAYKGTAVNVQAVGRDLGVRYVLEGSVRKAGERIRVTAQLSDAVTGHHVWAERYDRVPRRCLRPARRARGQDRRRAGPEADHQTGGSTRVLGCRKRPPRAAPLRPAQHQRRQPGREALLRPQPQADPPASMQPRLGGRVGLITGGDSGIGRAVALAFAEEGADVAIVYRNEHADAAKTRRDVEARGRRCVAMAGDVGNEAFCRRAVRETVRALGRLDILVNNAAEQHVQESLLGHHGAPARAHLSHQCLCACSS